MKMGVVFPGQGSQTLGMLSDLAEQFPEIQSAYAEASEVVGYDLWALVQRGPVEELDKTVHTQPALLAASYAAWQILKNHSKNSFEPTLLAGHSLGEYSALVCANSLSFKDGIRLVAARGQYMQEAVLAGVGALAAIVGLTDTDVDDICQLSAMNEVLTPANFNSVGQVVISGHKSAVERALVFAKEKGARLAKLLPVSVPSHCVLMKPAAERLQALLSALPIEIPTLPVLSNVDVKVYKTPEDIRSGLERQLYNPVRWVETIQKFAKDGVKEVIECGPGKVLTGLIKRISPELEARSFTYVANI
jgi:[acyl-carrier-protein] S-malonyltransferase